MIGLSGNSSFTVVGLTDNTNGVIVLHGGGNQWTGYGGLTNTGGTLVVGAGDVIRPISGMAALVSS